MQKIVSIAILMMLSLSLQAQSDSTAFFKFPADWLGTWKGTLSIFGVDAVKMQVPMELEIKALDSTGTRYAWGLVYNRKSDDYRPYELVLANETMGLWQIDEKNSIKIESYIRGNAFTSWFVVEGNRVLCLYERTEKGIEFRVVAGVESPVSSTGEGEQNGEKIPKVETYPATTFQHALLQKALN